MQVLFKNALIVDATMAEPVEGNVLVEDGLIRDLHAVAREAEGRRVIDLSGRALVPGLIDSHVHVVASLVNLSANANLPDATALFRSIPIMKGMLHRGFTTVRDVGGAPPAMADAVAQGLVEGPRIVPCGKALSRTGGHTDFRPRADTFDPYRWKDRIGALGRVADGVDEVRRAARQELRQGARFIKIMANGGVGSPTDPIAWMGYSAEEMTAAVQEAADAQTYVSAHLYTAAAIKRAVRCGVHSLEHCNVIDAEAAAMAAAASAVAVPTLIIFEALAVDGARLGLLPESIAKIEDVRGSGLRSLELLRDAGVVMAYGTDLLGEAHDRQSEEFSIRARVLASRDIFAAATTVGADLVGMGGQIGIVREGAFADLLVVQGNPLEDVTVLADPYRKIQLVMQGGVVKRELSV